MKPLVDFAKYAFVPSWSDLPMSEYVIVGPGSQQQPAVDRFRGNLAAWNLYWALAGRIESDDDGPVQLERLPRPADAMIERACKYAFRFSPESNLWTLSALMCKFDAETYMTRFWPAIAALLTLPVNRGHVFLE